MFVTVLFSFLVMNIVKAALLSNFNFIKMLQVMGARSFELAKNILNCEICQLKLVKIYIGEIN